jgi:hypothetical protein
MDGFKVLQKVYQNCKCFLIFNLIYVHLFQRLIKELVLLIFEDSMENGLKEGYFYPEWQLIQYVLPSLAAMGIRAFNVLGSCRLLSNFAGVISSIALFHYQGLEKEKSRSKSELLEPKWLVKNKMKNLKSLLRQVQKELEVLSGVSGQTNFVSEQFAAFCDAFHWSLDVDLLGDYDGDGLTNAYSKHVETEEFFTKLLISIKLGLNGVYKKPGKSVDSYKSKCIESFTITEMLMRKVLIVEPYSNCFEIFQLHELLDQKLKIELGGAQDLGRLEKRIDWKLVLEAKKLTYPQLLYIFMFEIFSILIPSDKRKSVKSSALFGERNPSSNMMSSIFPFCIKEQWQGVMWFLVIDLHFGADDHPAAHIKTARKSPRLYKGILKYAQEYIVSKKISDLPYFRANMLSPIRFCANCYKVECDLNICKFCKDDITFFAATCWFCSEDCENAFLDSGHATEHEDAVISRL